MNKIILITGQTATGKTKLALDLAQKHNGELINCDSRQIYKGLDIVTGKDIQKNSNYDLDCKIDNFNIGFYKLQPTNYNLQPINVWLYDIVSPNRYFSSFDYKTCAAFVIKKILKAGKTPIIIGGTYFYLKHLLYGVETENIPPNQKLRKELNNKPINELQDIIKKLDVQSFNRLNISDQNNPQRLIRKIEIMEALRHPGGGRTASPGVERIENIKLDFIGLRYKYKEDLKKAIVKRVEKRLQQGAIEETQKLLDSGYKEDDPGMKTIGIKQLIDFLKGRKTKNEAVEEWITKEMQYAKRQYTFMKKDPNIKWKEI